MTRRRHAFLIGANGTSWSDATPLKHAERDAQRLAQALKEGPCAFNVKQITADDNADTLEQLGEFANECKVGDLFVLHFSGHGHFDEKLYLICNNTKKKIRAIEIGYIKEILRNCGASYKILILDCCYSGRAITSSYKGGNESDNNKWVQEALQGCANVTIAASPAIPTLETARELDQLDGGAGYLSWVFLDACQTRFDKVAQDGCLSLHDIWQHQTTCRKEASALLHDGTVLPKPIKLEESTVGDLWFTAKKRRASERSDISDQAQRQEKLRVYILNHTSFIQERLSAFVGRDAERKEIQALIEQTKETGGYVTIHGQAGQGKSSIIASMVEETGVENVPHYFIPIDASPDEQTSILCSIMAHLILKHNLSDVYMDKTDLPVLRITFDNLLRDLAMKGIQETIFIDGLDQLPTQTINNENAKRDLSFLPRKPPSGIVFVLGTRSDDTLEGLDSLKPNVRYPLPNLTRSDFDLLLKHRNVHLEEKRCDHVYQTIQGALYLDLAAKELADPRNTDAEITQIIKKLEENPENLFSLALERWKQPYILWQDVLKPVLGTLITAHRPLSIRHIHEITGIKTDRLRDNIYRLGGFLTKDAQDCYTFFHLKLRDFLHNKNLYLFDEEELREYHTMLANWCVGENIASLWLPVRKRTDQERHNYAWQYAITHLYHAQKWERLFEILDNREFARGKMRSSNPNTHSYAQDLDLGRSAIVSLLENETEDKQISYLPRLWQYALLRCSLTSRSSLYPPDAYRLLLLLNRKQEALGMAELRTDKQEKAKALIEIAQEIAKQAVDKTESIELLIKAKEIIYEVEDPHEQSHRFRKLAAVFADFGQWEQATEVANAIQHTQPRVQALQDLGEALAKAERQDDALKLWRKASSLIKSRKGEGEKFQLYCGLGKVLAQCKQQEEAQAAWFAGLKALAGVKETNVQYMGYLSMARELSQIAGQGICYCPVAKAIQTAMKNIPQGLQKDSIAQVLGRFFVQENEWESALGVIKEMQDKGQQAKAALELAKHLIPLKQWDHARSVIALIGDRQQKALAFVGLGEALAVEQEREQALEAWTIAENTIGFSEGSDLKIRVLHALTEALVKETNDQETQGILREIERQISFIKAKNLSSQNLLLIGRLFSLMHKPEMAQPIWDRVKQSIASIQDSKRQNQERHAFARVLIEAQEWKQAEEILTLIAAAAQWTAESSELLGILLHEQQWESARAIITAISDVQKRLLIYYESAKTARQKQHWDQALEFSCAIEMRSLRVQALSELWLDLIQQGQDQQAQALAERIKKTIESFKSKQPQKDKARYQWSKILLAAQHYNEAYQVANTISDVQLRGEILIELWNNIQAQEQCQEQAQLVWAKIEEIVPAIQSDKQASHIWPRLNETLVNSKQWEKAYSFVQAIKDEQVQTEALQHLGERLAQARDWQAAETVIGAIVSTDHKIAGLLILANAYSQGGLLEIAYRVWKRVQQIIVSIRDSKQRDRSHRSLATALMQVQQWKQASEIIPLIKNTNRREEAWYELVNALTQAQQWEQATQVIKRITNKKRQAEARHLYFEASLQKKQWTQAQTIVNIFRSNIAQQQTLLEYEKRYTEVQQLHAEALLRGKRWNPALDIIDTIRPDIVQEQALLVAGKALFEAGQWEQAETAITRIKHYEFTLEKLIVLWKVSICKKDTKKAQNTWNILEQAIEGIKNNNQRTQALRTLAIATIQVKQWEQTQKVIDAFSTNRKQIEIFYQIGAAAIRVQYQEQAYMIWEKVERAIDTLRDPNEHLQALCKLGTILAQAQELEKANAIWLKAEQVIDNNESRPIQSLCMLAGVMTQVQQWEKAEALWEKAEKSITTLQSEREEQIAALFCIGEAYAQTRQYDRAEVVWLKAEQVIDTLDKNEQQLPYLQKLGEAFMRTRQREQSQRYWEKITQLINGIEDNEQCTHALILFARRLIELQEWEYAEIITNTIQDSKQQNQCLEELVKKLLQAKQWARAHDVIVSIPHKELQDTFRKTYAPTFISAQQWGYLPTIMSMIARNQLKPSLLREVLETLVKAEQLDVARQFIKTTIKNDETRAQALCELGIILVEADQANLVEDVWPQLEKAIASIEASNQLVQALREIGKALALAHEWDEAQKIINSITSPWQQVQSLIALGEAYARDEQPEKAENVWERITVLLERIGSQRERAQGLVLLAKAYAQNGKETEAEAAWNSAESIIATIKDTKMRAHALNTLAENLAQAKQWDPTCAIVATIADDELQARALGRLIEELALAREYERAEEVIKKLRDEEQLARAYVFIGSAYAADRLKEKAQKMWNQAEQLISKMQNKRKTVEPLSALVRAFVQVNNRKQEKAKWEEANRIIDDMKAGPERSWAIRSLGQHVSAVSRYDYLLFLIQKAWSQVQNREDANILFPLVCSIITRHPSIGVELYEVFNLVDHILKES